MSADKTVLPLDRMSRIEEAVRILADGIADYWEAGRHGAGRRALSILNGSTVVGTAIGTSTLCADPKEQSEDAPCAYCQAGKDLESVGLTTEPHDCNEMRNGCEGDTNRHFQLARSKWNRLVEGIQNVGQYGTMEDGVEVMDALAAAEIEVVDDDKIVQVKGPVVTDEMAKRGLLKWMSDVEPDGYEVTQGEIEYFRAAVEAALNG